MPRHHSSDPTPKDLSWMNRLRFRLVVHVEGEAYSGIVGGVIGRQPVRLMRIAFAIHGLTVFLAGGCLGRRPPKSRGLGSSTLTVRAPAAPYSDFPSIVAQAWATAGWSCRHQAVASCFFHETALHIADTFLS
jgi:hypothetical protein